MLPIKPLSQRDPQWAGKKLGFSNLTIGNYGCTLTCLTMLLNYLGYSETPATVNDNLKKVGAFTGALILWANVPKAYPKLKWVTRGYNYNNLTVWWQINIKKVPVMVEVNAARIGAAKHWVLFIGDAKMADPWTGTISPTSTYPLTGYAIYDKA